MLCIRLFLSAFLFVAICNNSIAQLTHYYPIKQQGKWGYVDSTGEVIIKPIYDSTFDYSGTTAIAILKGEMIVINPGTNRVVLPPSKAYIQITDNIFIYMQNNMWGLRSTESELLPLTYKKIEFIGGDYLKISTDGNNFGVYSLSKQKIILDQEYKDFKIVANDYISAKSKYGIWSLYDKSGKWLIDKEIKSLIFFTDYIVFCETNYKQYLFNTKLNKILDLPFEKVMNEFGNNLVVLKQYNGVIIYNKETGNYKNFINISNIVPLTERFYRFDIKDNQGIIDNKFDTIIPPIYKTIIFTSNRFLVADETMNVGIIDTQNNIIIPIKNNWITGYDSMYYIVKRDSIYGVYSWNGKIVVPFKYKKISNYKKSLKCFYKNSIDIFELDSTAKIVSKTTFDGVSEIAVVGRNNEKTLNFDLSKAISLPQPIGNNRGWGQNRNNAIPLVKTAHWVTDSPELGINRYVNIRDSVIIPPRYRFVQPIDTTPYTIYGNVVDRKPKKIMGIYADPNNYYYGIVNHNTGKEIFKAIYLWIDGSMLSNTNGKFTRAITKDTQFVLIHTDGKVYKDGYIYMSKCNSGRIKAYKGGKILLSNNTGRTLNLIPRASVSEFYMELGRDINARAYRSRYYDYLTYNYINFVEGSWVYIDSLAQTIISDSFEYIEPFVQNSAIVRKNGLWGVVDTNGNWLIQPLYYAVKLEYSNGNLIYKLINRVGGEDENMTAQGEAIAIIKRGDKYSFIRNDGTLVTDSLYDDVTPFENGYASVKKKGFRVNERYHIPDRWFILSEDGELSGEFENKDMSLVGDGLVPFYMNVSRNPKRTRLNYGFKNLYNDTIIFPKYKRVGKFVDGLCNVKTDSNKWGYINKEGEMVISPKFLSARPFNKCGFARVYNSNNNILYINTHGKELKYKPIDETSTNSYQVLKHLTKNTYKIYDKEGKNIGTYRKCISMSAYSDGYVLREKKHWLWGYKIFSYIDSAGKIKAKYAKYTWMTPYADGYALACNKYTVFHRGWKADTTKYIVIDKEGNEIDLHFQPERKFKPVNGIILGHNKAKNGDLQLFSIYNEPINETILKSAFPFEFGVSRVKLVSNKWALMNTKGEIITQTTFDEIKPFRPAGEANQKLVYGLADNRGNIILDPIYTHVKVYGNSVIKVENNNLLGYINSDGKWIWGLQ